MGLHKVDLAQQDGPRFGQSHLHGHPASRREGLIRAVDRVMLAVDQCHADIDNREPSGPRASASRTPSSTAGM